MILDICSVCIVYPFDEIDPKPKVDLFSHGGCVFLKTLSRFFVVLVWGYLLPCYLLPITLLSIASLRHCFAIASPLYRFASLRHYLYMNINSRQQTTTNGFLNLNFALFIRLRKGLRFALSLSYIFVP